MGQDVTTRVSVLGQNPDGSLNVAMQGNPFAVGSAGAATAMQSQGAAQAYIGRELITFGSEADMLKAKLAIQNLSGGGAGGAPQLAPGGGGGPGGGSSSWLPLAANAGSAINNLFMRSNLDRKAKDYKNHVAALAESRRRLEGLATKYPDLIPTLLEINDAERAATETAQSLLEDLLQANGVAIGVDVVRAANDYLSSSSYSSQSLFSGGSGGTLLAAGLGAGAGLLLSRNNNK
jgi:hypothetical protein